MNINDDNLRLLLRDKPCDIDLLYHGMTPYVFKKMIKSTGESFDWTEMVEEKAQFEHKADEFKKRNR